MAQPHRSWPNLIAALLRGEDLDTADTAWAMGEIMAGAATPVQIAGFMIALRAKGESPAEITGFADAMLAAATPLHLPDAVRAEAVDIVGTGGDRAHTVNISTMGSLVLAGAGLRVIKHGNRAASSSCGSADLLEYLGIPLDLGADAVARCIIEVGIGFCFAAAFHPGMRHTAVTRRELGNPTAFNFLGPLTNPVLPRAGAVGCADARMSGVLARILADRGASVLVMRGEDGLDEFTTCAPTRIWIASGGAVTETVLDAVDLGLDRAKPDDLRGADAAFNGDVARRVLAGERGPVRDAVLLNAAAALVAHDAVGSDSLADDLADKLRAGIQRAAEAVDSGAAAASLDRWVALAGQLRAAA
jgi:anthranilate phosphoribosyltransferase